MKLKYASAFTDNNDIDNNKKYPIDNDRSRKFIEIVEARTQEIIENVYSQIPSEYIDKLLGGIILTGGGSNMKNIDVAFRNITHIEKIRIAKFVHQTINSNSPSITAQDGSMNTVLAILAKGDMNCAGDELSNDLFNNNVDTRSNGSVLSTDVPKTPRTPGTGVVMTEAEKKKRHVWKKNVAKTLLLTRCSEALRTSSRRLLRRRSKPIILNNKRIIHS